MPAKAAATDAAGGAITRRSLVQRSITCSAPIRLAASSILGRQHLRFVREALIGENPHKVKELPVVLGCCTLSAVRMQAAREPSAGATGMPYMAMRARCVHPCPNSVMMLQ